MFQTLLAKPKELQLSLLRHMTKGDIKSSSFPSGSTPLVTGAGERLTITTFPRQVREYLYRTGHQHFVTLSPKLKTTKVDTTRLGKMCLFFLHNHVNLTHLCV